MRKMNVRYYIDVEVPVPDNLDFQAGYALNVVSNGLPHTCSFNRACEALKKYATDNISPHYEVELGCGFFLESVELSDDMNNKKISLYNEGDSI